MINTTQNTFRIDLYVHVDSSATDTLLTKVSSIMATLDDLVTKVTALTAVDDSVVALLQDLKTRLDAAGTDPAKLQALSDSIATQTQRLADAVTANTPAAASASTA